MAHIIWVKFLWPSQNIITLADHDNWETLPERIYNSHYGNGVPAMFTS